MTDAGVIALGAGCSQVQSNKFLMKGKGGYFDDMMRPDILYYTEDLTNLDLFILLCVSDYYLLEILLYMFANHLSFSLTVRKNIFFNLKKKHIRYFMKHNFKFMLWL